MDICDGINTLRKSRKYMKTSLEHSGWSNDKTWSTKSYNSYMSTCIGIESDTFLNSKKIHAFVICFHKEIQVGLFRHMV